MKHSVSLPEAGTRHCAPRPIAESLRLLQVQIDKERESQTSEPERESETPASPAQDITNYLIRLGWYPRYLEFNPLKSKDWPTVKKFIDNQGNIRNLVGIYFAGGVGTGKSTMMGITARYLRYIRPLVSPRYVTVGMLSKLWREFKHEEADKYMTSEILFLDEIGTNPPTDFQISNLETFIEYRYGNNKTTFAAGNIRLIETDPNKIDLRKVVGYERIADRMCDTSWMGMIEIVGQSKRD